MTRRLPFDLAAIAELCRRYGVRQLALFGSAASDDFDPSRSDLDFVVDLGDLPPAEYADAYFGLREDLEALVGRPVDLLTAPSVRNPYLRHEVERTALELYAA